MSIFAAVIIKLKGLAGLIEVRLGGRGAIGRGEWSGGEMGWGAPNIFPKSAPMVDRTRRLALYTTRWSIWPDSRSVARVLSLSTDTCSIVL